MIALDTNVLVRLLVKDDPVQTAQVVSLFERLDSNGERAHVSEIVACETVWVLRSAYGFGRSTIVGVLEQLLAARQLVFDAPDRLFRAVAAFGTGKGDFSDYLIREEAREAGCGSVATFDRALLADAMFVAPADASDD